MFSGAGPIILAIVTFVSILVAIILHAVTIDQFQYSHPPIKYDKNVTINDDPKQLMWFLQITDLHLSCIGHEGRRTDLRKFATEYVSIIRPSVVLATGDLTDGRTPGTIFDTGEQFEEWQAYSSIIKESGVLNKTIWLDIRGNHDNFNVYRPQDPSVMYRKYSVQGRRHPRNYMYTLTKAGHNYTFIGIDGVQTPGLKIPFNFIGVVDQTDLNQLKSFVDKIINIQNDYTIWFGHYPTSSIASPSSLRTMINGPYLCGHYHTTNNLVMKMHATQQPGFAELELGDWKYNRRLRLAAVDHQLFSFVDIDFNDWPIALMTNPKPAQYAMPKYEPTCRMLASTHIRVLAFSNCEIQSVRLMIDDGNWIDMDHKEGPLYVLRWKPEVYNKGLHAMKVLVSDAKKQQNVYEQEFSLDGSKSEHTLGGRFLMRLHFKSYVMSLFYFLMAVATLPLVLTRIARYRGYDKSMNQMYRGTLIYNIHLIANIDRLFWPLTIIPLWLAVGPIFFGRLLDNIIGVCFIWGILIDNTFIHTGITYAVGTLAMIIHLIIIIILSSKVNEYRKYLASEDHRNNVRLVDLNLFVYLLLTVIQLLVSTIFYSAYGTLAFLTSFPFSWCTLIYMYCWRQIVNLQQNDFQFTRTTL